MDNVSLGRRLGALLIDWIVAALTAAAVAGVSYPPADVQENLIITACFVIEVTLLTGMLGTTIGKRILRLRVEGPDGRPIGLLRALVRTILLSLVIPAVVMNHDQRGLHDIAARSRVVRG